MTRDDKIAALLRELEAEKRRSIDQLGVPPWENEVEVARVAEQRIVVEEYSEFCSGLISSGYFQTSDEPFVFIPPIELEWQPDLPEDFNYNRTELDDFAAALESGRKKEVARLAFLLRKGPPPQRVLNLIADDYEGKIKTSPNRPPGPVRALPSRELKALMFSERLQSTLRDMFPTHKRNAVKGRAKKIAAAKYAVTVDALEDLIRQGKSRRR
jgi:hypothetical protein